MQIEELRGIALFEGLRHEQLALLAPLLRRVVFPAGATPFTQGDTAGELYLLESGQVAIRTSPYDGGYMNIATIQPEGIFGWSAVLGRPRYTASAVCLIDAQALAIRGRDLRRVMRSDSELSSLLLERMAQIAADRSGGLRDQLTKLLQADAGDEP